MDPCFIPFDSEIDPALVPADLNNAFASDTPAICKIAAVQLQEFIMKNEPEWLHNFGLDKTREGKGKGKMFGILVVKAADDALGYLCTFSGKMTDEPHHPVFVPSLFDIASDDHFITKGMLEVNAIGDKIKSLELAGSTNDLAEIEFLKDDRKTKSAALQQQLFLSYNFLNYKGEVKNVCAIFEEDHHKVPPSGTGECAAPKLLHYAFKHNMRPLAIAEFWWGRPSSSGKKQHLAYYPACRDKCGPLLGWMLGKSDLSHKA